MSPRFRLLFQQREIAQSEVKQVLRRSIGLSLVGIPVGYVAGGVLFTAFALHMGMTKFHFGVLGTLLSVMGVLRVLSPAVEERCGNRKYAWFMLVTASRLALLPLVLGVFLKLDPWVIVGLVAFHGALSSLAAPIWQSWTWDYVPVETFAGYWATRKFWQKLVNTCFLVGVAFAIDRVAPQHQRVVLSGMFALFIAIGLLHVVWHLTIPEPPKKASAKGNMAKLVDSLRNRAFRNLLLLMALWTFAASICAPFVAPYMLDDLGLRGRLVIPVVLMQVVPTVCSLATLWLWGRALDGRHIRAAMVVSASFWSIIPVFYYLAVPGNMPAAMVMLLAAAAIGGVFPVGFGLAKVLLTVRMSGRDKTMPAALMVVVPSLGGILGTMLGTYYVSTADPRGVFLLSFAARVAVVFVVCLLLPTFDGGRRPDA